MKKIFIIFVVLIFSITVFGQRNKTSAENFNAISLDGQSFELENLKGKVVLLTFWSTNCPICQSEIPKLNRLAESFKGKEVVFLAPTMENADTVEPFLRRNPFSFNILPDSFGIVLKFAERDERGRLRMGFPAHYLINQNGEIELKNEGFGKTESIKAAINRLLNE